MDTRTGVRGKLTEDFSNLDNYWDKLAVLKFQAKVLDKMISSIGINHATNNIDLKASLNLKMY